MEQAANITLGQLLGGGAGVFLLLSVFIEVAPVKISPVSSFLKWLGKKINSEVIEKVDKLETDVSAMKAATEEQAAITCRVRILRFGDEVLHNTHHSKDHFCQVLQDIDIYERYCRDHEDFANNMTQITTEKIKDVYKKRLDQNDFL